MSKHAPGSCLWEGRWNAQHAHARICKCNAHYVGVGWGEPGMIGTWTVRSRSLMRHLAAEGEQGKSAHASVTARAPPLERTQYLWGAPVAVMGT